MARRKIARKLRTLYTYLICPSASKVFTHLTEHEKRALYSLARGLQQDSPVVVEVGSYLGASSMYIGAGLKRKPGAQFYCVDTWGNDAMTEGERDTWKEFHKNTERFKSIQPLRGESVKVAAEFDQEIDFLFLDGDHSYEGVKADVDIWLPKLHSGSIIAMHDIGWAEGVQRVVAEDVKPTLRDWDSLPNLFWGTIR